MSNSELMYKLVSKYIINSYLLYTIVTLRNAVDYSVNDTHEHINTYRRTHVNNCAHTQRRMRPRRDTAVVVCVLQLHQYYVYDRLQDAAALPRVIIVLRTER